MGKDPTRVEFLCEKMYSASRLPLALANGRPYHSAGSRGETIHVVEPMAAALYCQLDVAFAQSASGVPAVAQEVGRRQRTLRVAHIIVMRVCDG
jgi:hypothetical protein